MGMADADDLRCPVDVHHSGGLHESGQAMTGVIDCRGIGLTSSDVPRIMCAVCQKPVDCVEWETRHDVCRLRVKVYCHGDTDTCEIPDEVLEDAATMGTGWAFVTKRVAGSAVTGIDSALIGPDQPDK